MNLLLESWSLEGNLVLTHLHIGKRQVEPALVDGMERHGIGLTRLAQEGTFL